MDRFKFHGDRIVARFTVTDCPRRHPAGVDVDGVDFAGRFRVVVDEILELLRRPQPRSLAEDNRAQYNALAELNRKNAAFWKGRAQ